MRLPLRHAVLALALLATSLAGAGPAQAKATRQAVPPPLLRAAVADLTVATENREGYKRTSFKHWVDADGDGCSARYEVLIAEAIDPPEVGPRCALAGGVWYSYYDDQIVTDATKLDVDHLVSAPTAS
ncbi:hypothetical protein [Nonomuraea sp. NPDC049758]|uniref:hypothetical protein n=1 Tax=Nonomuraea sp. NPDC049758 TaxID=3154360 RepID=UPI00341E2B62